MLEHDLSYLADHAYIELETLIQNLPENATVNEASVRLHLIDSMIFNVLNWPRCDVDPESYVRETGYADYMMSIKGSPALIVEAKRTDSTFVLNEQKYSKEPVPFSLISKNCPEALKAMIQACQYACTKGARYVAISNGFQWILMLTQVEGTEIEKRKVFVFESLEAIKERFSLFWNCFSQIAISVNAPFSQLIDTYKLPAPPKLSKSIPNHPSPRHTDDVRNKHATTIQYVWDEINSNETYEHFFKECYVLPPKDDKRTNLAKEMLSQRLLTDTQIGSSPLRATDIVGVIKDTHEEKPILLLGRIGRGKSTFIRYLQTEAATKELSKYIQLHINFLDTPRTPKEASKYLFEQVEKILEEKYSIDIKEDKFVRAALHGPIQRFKKSPRGILFPPSSSEYKVAELQFIEENVADKHSYYTRVFQHLRSGRQYSLAIFFDNLDKRQFELQEEVFLLASSIARDWEALVFVCLRPGTFHQSRDAGILDSISPKIIHVLPPPTFLFLKRRFEYAKQILDGVKPLPGISRSSLSKEMSAQARDASMLFDCFVHSISRSKDLENLFRSVSNGNLREVIRYVSMVITSSHLNTTEILDKINQSGTYTVAYHQALRAILYQDTYYYDPSRPPFINLFDIRHSNPTEHFSRSILLQYLSTFDDSSANDGYATIDEVYQYMAMFGYAVDHIDDTIEYLFNKRCVEDNTINEKWVRTSDVLRITFLGEYHIHFLISKFVYHDAIIDDTPIIDKKASGFIKSVSTLSQRLERAREFLRYLNDCSVHLSHPGFREFWENVHSDLASDITNVENAAGIS